MKPRYKSGYFAAGNGLRTTGTSLRTARATPQTAATRLGPVFSAALCTIFTAALWGMVLYSVTSATQAAAQTESVSITADPGPAPAEELAERRERIRQGMGSGIMVLFGAEPKVFSNDVNYPYRQESNLFYLTGISQPGAALVLLPGNRSQKEILFLPRRDPAREIWTGHMIGVEEARQRTGIAHVWPIEEFDGFVEAVLHGSIYGKRPSDDAGDYRAIGESVKNGTAVAVWLLADASSRYSSRYPRALRFTAEAARFPAVQVRLASGLFRDLRVVKSDWELQRLQRAVDITRLAQRAIMRRASGAGGPGGPLNESVLDGIILSIYRAHGAHWGFPSIVASGPNATTLHYEENNREIASGELVLADIGAAVGYYTADVTRTFPVGGVFSKAQREVYEVVLDAHARGVAAVRPGMTMRRVHEVARKVIADGLLKLGLITSTSGNQYRMWYMHGTSHWIGLDVHDVGGRDMPFRPGMVITVEPGIYVREDTLENLDDTPRNRALIEAIRPAFERYRNIGVRIEDDVLVTEDGHRVLSEGTPRTIEDVEAFMANPAP
ncbi:MAG: aminopeptidase P family protein [Gemmatimonadota bacterium]|nr:aminopeptidase P family protein [Gemmatimonadota bacterium]